MSTQEFKNIANYIHNLTIGLEFVVREEHRDHLLNIRVELSKLEALHTTQLINVLRGKDEWFIQYEENSLGNPTGRYRWCNKAKTPIKYFPDFWLIAQ